MRAWLALSGIVTAAWLAILSLVYLLERVIAAYREPLLRAFLGLSMLGLWVVLMALIVELTRRAIGGKLAPKEGA